MVSRYKQDFLTASVGKQVQMLKDVMYEIETEHLNGEALAWRIHAVEDQLRRIRESMSTSHETNIAV